MKKTAIILSALLAASCAFAGDNKDNKSWLETTLKGLKTKVAGKYQSSSVGASSVAAVRGAEMKDDASKPYWKGSQSSKGDKKLNAQRKAFAAALELGVAGKSDEAAKSLEKFIKDNPESPYLSDAKEALSRVQAPAEAASAPAQPAEAAGEPAAAPKPDGK
ncbi:MAG: hypothetical protein PHP45_00335 [Elusimicrobiales bacterium]|nr:hypothetical protein [Elusimicrobiales bacterium]